MKDNRVADVCTKLIAMIGLATAFTLTGCSEPVAEAETSVTIDAVPAPPEVDAFGMVLLSPAQIEELKRKALAGNEAAMTEFIDRHLEGMGVPEDDGAAYRFAEQGANMGMVDAKAAFGEALQFGYEGIPKDEARGQSLLEEAAALGNERAMRTFALRLAVNRELDTKEQKAPLLDYEILHGIKDGRSARLMADLCLRETFRATGKELSDAWACFDKWSKRMASAASVPRVAEALRYQTLIPRSQRAPWDREARQPAAIQKELADLKATYRSDAALIAKARAEHAKNAFLGEGVPKNAEEAVAYALNATQIEGVAGAENAREVLRLAYAVLADAYDGIGAGVPNDDRRAYGWMILLKGVGDPEDQSSGLDEALATFESIVATQGQLQEVQRAIANRKPGEDLNLPARGSPDRDDEPSTSAGTAFVVSDDGFAITNAHVVEGCSAVQDGQGSSGVVVAQDATNDLAALRFGSYREHPFAKLEASPRLPRVGDRIAVFGFPLSEVLAASGNLTAGEVSATSGLGNNSSMFQVTAPIQPGSSGSPVLSLRGNVAGVISSTASTPSLAQATGTLAQNLNFAIKKDTVAGFLRANGIPFTEAVDGFFSGSERSIAEVGDEAKKWTIRVTCER